MDLPDDPHPATSLPPSPAALPAASPAAEAPDIRQRLTRAGLHEFAQFGFPGARLDRVAAEAGCAKRMIYYYFGSKELFYLAVLRESYADIRRSEADLDLDALAPPAALHRLARHSFDYHEKNLEFTRLVLVENLQSGRMMEQIGHEAEALRSAAFEPLARLLARGAATGQFRAGVNPVEVHYIISAHSCYRLDHAGTWNKLLKVDLLSPEMRETHVAMMLAALDQHVGARLSGG